MPSADVAVKLAKALNTSVEYLVTGEKSVFSSKESSENSRKLIHLYENMSESQQKLLLLVAEDISKCLK